MADRAADRVANRTANQVADRAADRPCSAVAGRVRSVPPASYPRSTAAVCPSSFSRGRQVILVPPRQAACDPPADGCPRSTTAASVLVPPASRDPHDLRPSRSDQQDVLALRTIKAKDEIPCLGWPRAWPHATPPRGRPSSSRRGRHPLVAACRMSPAPFPSLPLP